MPPCAPKRCTEIVDSSEGSASRLSYVTHGPGGGPMTMADRIRVMMEGDVRPAGTRAEVHDNARPDKRVAAFIRTPTMNLLPGSVHGCRRNRLDLRALPAPGRADKSGIQAGPVSRVGVAPKHVRLTAAGAPDVPSPV
jgi:ABC-type sugar transport system ATPase subunit